MSPRPKPKKYGYEKWGYAGELGTGAHVQLKFLQTGLSIEDLDQIELIENIPGSEKWDVQDLFQRSVDKERVHKKILPYLKDDSNVKFFNPLTLIVLPWKHDEYKIEQDLDYISPKSESEDDFEFEVFEKPNYYKLSVCADAAFSKLEWNTKKVKIVAIDGQHRLSALKTWEREEDSEAELTKWTIPAVMITPIRESSELNVPTILEIARRTFLYINKEAVQVNRSREILLDDESVNAICVQELINYSHKNDQKDRSEIDSNRIPLAFYDWRGEVKAGKEYKSETSLLSVVEIYEIFTNYLLDDDGTDRQYTALDLENIPSSLHTFGKDQKLSKDDAEDIREQFRKSVLPGLSHLLESFTPYKTYLENFRKLYDDSFDENEEIARHAWMRLLFGSDRADPSDREYVDALFKEILRKIVLEKQRVPDLIGKDIGVRAVFFAFAETREMREEYSGSTVPWSDHAKWFVPLLNEVFDQGWFNDSETQDEDQQKFLKWIALDPLEHVINYRHKDVAKAFGPLVSLLVSKSFSKRDKDDGPELLQLTWDNLKLILEGPLMAGFRKEVRSDLRDSYHGTAKQLNAKIKRDSEKETFGHINALASYLGVK